MAQELRAYARGRDDAPYEVAVWGTVVDSYEQFLRSGFTRADLEAAVARLPLEALRAVGFLLDSEGFWRTSRQHRLEIFEAAAREPATAARRIVAAQGVLEREFFFSLSEEAMSAVLARPEGIDAMSLLGSEAFGQLTLEEQIACRDASAAEPRSGTFLERPVARALRAAFEEANGSNASSWVWNTYEQANALRRYARGENIPGLIYPQDQPGLPDEALPQVDLGTPRSLPAHRFESVTAPGLRYDLPIDGRMLPIFAPLEVVRDGLDVKEVAATILALRPQIRREFASITLEPRFSPRDFEAQTRLGYFTRARAAIDPTTGHVSLYPVGWPRGELAGSLRHEAGHRFAYRRLGDTSDGPGSVELERARLEDGLYSSLLAVRGGNREANAESYDLYWASMEMSPRSRNENREAFSKTFEVIEKYLD